MANQFLAQLTQPTMPQTPQLPNVNQPTVQPKQVDYNGFRSFVLKKYPNISTTQLQQLDQTISARQRADLVRSGVLDVGEVAKSDPGMALKLSQEGFQPGMNISGEKRVLGDAGLQQLELAEQIFQKSPTLTTLAQAIPWQPLTRQFNSAMFGAINSLLRAQTGAVAPEHEIKAYMSVYGPVPGDSAEDVAAKFNNLRNILAQYSGKAQTNVANTNRTNLGIGNYNTPNAQNNDPLGLGL